MSTVAASASECGAEKATATAWNPRGPNSSLSLLRVWATRTQCIDLMKKNSSATTLPLKLESEIAFPDASKKDNSGALRGTGPAGTAAVEKTSKNTAITAMNLCIMFAKTI